MSDLSLVLNQLKQNNEEETSRDKNINKNIAFSRDINKESLLALGKTIMESVTGTGKETGKIIEDTQKQSDANADKGSKSSKKEDEKDADAKDKKQTNLLQRIASGITSLPNTIGKGAAGGAKKGFGAILGILSFFSGGIFGKLFKLVKKIPKFGLLAIPAILLSVFDAEDFKKFGAYLKEKVLPAINTFYNETIKPAFDSLMEFFKNEAFPQIKTFVMDKAIPAITKVYEDILKPAFSSMVDFFKTDGIAAIKGLFDKLKEFYVKIEPNLKALFGFLKETTFPALIEGIKELFVNVAEIFGKIFDFLGNIISGDFTAAFGDLADIGGLIVKAIGGVVDTVLGMFGLGFEGGIINAIKSLFTGIITFFENMIRGIPGVGNKLADKLFGELTGEELEKRERKELMEEAKKKAKKGMKVGEGKDRRKTFMEDEILAELAKEQEEEALKDFEKTQKKIAKMEKMKGIEEVLDPSNAANLSPIQKAQKERYMELQNEFMEQQNELNIIEKRRNDLAQGNFEIKDKAVDLEKIESSVAKERNQQLEENAKAKSESANAGGGGVIATQVDNSQQVKNDNLILESDNIGPLGSDSVAANLASEPG